MEDEFIGSKDSVKKVEDLDFDELHDEVDELRNSTYTDTGVLKRNKVDIDLEKVQAGHIQADLC